MERVSKKCKLLPVLSLFNIPRDVIINHILTKLDLQSLGRFNQANKRTKRLGKDHRVWASLLETDYAYSVYENVTNTSGVDEGRMVRVTTPDTVAACFVDEALYKKFLYFDCYLDSAFRFYPLHPTTNAVAKDRPRDLEIKHFIDCMGYIPAIKLMAKHKIAEKGYYYNKSGIVTDVVMNGDFDAFMCLVDNGLDVETTGAALMQVALCNGSARICKYLLKNNIDFKWNIAVLGRAFGGNVELFKMFVDQLNDTLEVTRVDLYKQVLRSARRDEHLDIIDVMLADEFVKLDGMQACIDSLLISAAAVGQSLVIEHLLKRGFNAMRVEALFVAIKNGKKESVELLCKSIDNLGECVNTRNDRNESVLYSAVKRVSCYSGSDILEIVIENGATDVIPNRLGDFPLALAISEKRLATIRRLIEAKMYRC